MSYKLIGQREGDLEKLEVFIAKEKVPTLSQVVPREKAAKRARKLALALKELIPKQNFAVAIQVALGSLFEEENSKNLPMSQIVAREILESSG